MTKTELIKEIAKKAGLTQAQAGAAYQAFIATVTETLKAGDKLTLVGFGTIEVKSTPAKTGVNPRTGEKINIAASKKPVVKFGKAYKDEINQ